MGRMLTVFVTALLVVVGCDGVPAPAQYDHAMLRKYFGKSPAEVKDTFGKPSSITHAASQLPPENTTAKDWPRNNFPISQGDSSIFAVRQSGQSPTYFFGHPYVSLEYEGREDARTAIPKSLALLRKAFTR